MRPASAAVGASDGHYAMGYYDETDLPFYYWLASTFAMSDRYFGSALGGTWANRDYLYAGTSAGVMNTGQATIRVPTIFDALEAAGIEYGVYTDGTVRQDCLGWTNAHRGVGRFSALISALADGTLPPVVRERLASATDEQFSRYSRRILRAETLDEMLDD